MKEEYKKIAPKKVMEMMKNDPNIIILDVRSMDERESGYIDNSICLPLPELKKKAKQILPDKNKTILVYCHSGVRSQKAAQALLEMNYTQVYDFGGIIYWPCYLIVKKYL